MLLDLLPSLWESIITALTEIYSKVELNNLLPYKYVYVKLAFAFILNVSALLLSMRLKALSIIYLLSLFLLGTSKIEAQGQSLSIYPPVLEVQATPPSSPVVPLIIQNNNNEDITLRIELIPIKQSGLNGDIQLVPELINEGFYPYYRNKIQFLVDDRKVDSLILSPLETKEVNVNINLTEGDPPGDYYYSIVFISGSSFQDETSLSQLPAGIASNLLLSIGPKKPAGGGIVEFDTSTFKNSGPVDFSLKLHNASKHLIAPSGSVSVYNLFGQKVGSIDLLSQYILANSDRYLVDEIQSSPSALLTNSFNSAPKVIWSEKFLLGFYTAEAKVLLEENGHILSSKTYFFAFPLYLFFPLVILIFIALSIYLRVKKKV